MPPALQAAAPPPFEPVKGLEIYADTQDSKGSMRTAEGHVEIRTGGVVLYADQAEYNEATGELMARGNVRYWNSNGKEEIHCKQANYNIKTEKGTFYEAYGTVSSATQAGARLLTTDNPFYIEGPLIFKSGERYTVQDGLVTNCDPDDKWWTMRSPKTHIRPGKSATIKNGVFRLKGAPIFYFPYFKKSLERVPRQSGFLTPSVGTSSRFGFVAGQSYYWAINRSYDATIGGTLYSARGLASNVAFRGRPTKNSTFDASFFGVKDRGFKTDSGDRIKQGGRTLKLKGTALFPGGFRAVADITMLSSLEFRQAFTQSFEEAVQSQVRSIGFITKNFSTFSINASVLRDENFQSVERGDTVILRKLPSVEFNSHDRQLFKGPVPLWFSFDNSFDLVSRSQPAFQTRKFVQRGDFYPRVMSNFYWKGFHVTPTLGARYTSYGQSFRNGSITGSNVSRTTGEVSVDIAPPALQRIYNGPKWLGDKIKHVIEPRLRYRYVRGVEDFDVVVRFDDRDILNNTNEAEISITNRLYSKRESTGLVREVLSLEVWQRRYFDAEFGGAIAPGRRNVLSSSLYHSPFAFIDRARNYSPISAALRTQPTHKMGLEWRTDYDPLREKIVNSSVSANYQVHPLLLLETGHYAVRAPTTLSPPTNQVRTMARIGDFNRRGWNAAVSNIYDYRQGIFIYTASQISYNTDCCGFGFEVRRFAIGPTRNENQFRISLSIANVGSFGTLRPTERLF